MLEEARAERIEPKAPPQIGAASQWVPEDRIERIETPSASTRTPLESALDSNRALVLRLLQSIYHTLLAIQLLWSKNMSGSVFNPLELRHLARVMLAALPVLALGRMGSVSSSQNNLCASVSTCTSMYVPATSNASDSYHTHFSSRAPLHNRIATRDC